MPPPENDTIVHYLNAVMGNFYGGSFKYSRGGRNCDHSDDAILPWIYVGDYSFLPVESCRVVFPQQNEIAWL